MVIIKKYKNRILYDTSSSSPVTLNGLAEMLKQNVQVRILDNDSGRDITCLTLIQAMLDLERSGKGIQEVFPGVLLWLKGEIDSFFREVVFGGNLGMCSRREWASRVVGDGIRMGLISSDDERRVTEEVTEMLGDIFVEVMTNFEKILVTRLEYALVMRSALAEGSAGLKRINVK